MDDDWTLASFGDFAVCHVLRGLAAAAAAAAVILAISANRLPFSALALASAATSTFIAAAWMRLVKNPPWDLAVIGLHLLLICGWVVTSRQSDPTGVAALALMPAALQRKRL
ncbi:MAG: hypothetical protein LBR32_00585, partial [Propionibacteriaceae bacterium]|nr:hypothetical protein [Propionibacteriaceae bacterium]